MRNMWKDFQDRDTIFVVLASLIFFLISVYIGAISEGDTIAGEESFNHFLISKYSLIHPELFLNLYGRPVFTILSAFPAQFGILGVKVMNILITIGYSILSYKIAKKLHLKYPLIAFFTCLLIPYASLSELTSLSEPLAALLSILVFYLAIEGRYLSASLIISFLPYTRPETIFLLLLWIIFLLSKKEYMNILFCLFGTLVFQSIGFLYYKDLFWLITQNPNLSNPSTYVYKASPFVYLSNIQVFANPVFSLLILFGIVSFFSSCKKAIMINRRLLLLFLYMWPLTNLLLISVSQWIGIFGAYRYLRYLIPLIPFVALFSAKGYEEIMRNRISFKLLVLTLLLFVYWVIFPPGDADIFYHSPWLDILLITSLTIVFGIVTLVLPIFKLYHLRSQIVMIVIFFASIGALVFSYKLPLPLNEEQEVMKQVAVWIKENGYSERKMYYFYPYLSYLLDHDPYSTKHVEAIGAIKTHPIENKALIVWDGHFSPNEENIPLTSLWNSPKYKLLKIFVPEKKLLTENDSLFEVFIFQKN